jgi:hypothetical protein
MMNLEWGGNDDKVNGLASLAMNEKTIVLSRAPSRKSRNGFETHMVDAFEALKAAPFLKSSARTEEYLEKMNSVVTDTMVRKVVSQPPSPSYQRSNGQGGGTHSPIPSWHGGDSNGSWADSNPRYVSWIINLF